MKRIRAALLPVLSAAILLGITQAPATAMTLAPAAQEHVLWQRLPEGRRWERPDRLERRRTRRGPQGAHGAPEIDPGLLSGALVLLLGGTLVLAARRRDRCPQG